MRVELGTEDLFAHFRGMNRTSAWCDQLERCVEETFEGGRNGHLQKWLAAYESIPEGLLGEPLLSASAVSVVGEIGPAESAALRSALMALSPWRKGPFQLFDIFLDTEWRSNLKWERLAESVSFAGKDILDVGCGNGYYGWRMLGAGANRVVGLDPNLLFSMQFAALRRLLGPLPNFVLPAGDTMIANNLRAFDLTLSMGVLYHRKSPFEHLQLLAHSLRPGGEVVLETLVIEGGEREVLVPEDRYAQMNNVWMLPSCPLLQRMMQRCGFVDVKVVDVTLTTVEEQRSTEWMRFDSLPKFLSPQDPSLTVEGYPAPLRAILTGRKR